LRPGDTDVNVDVYERSGAVLTRRTPGNGAFDAIFAGASADGSHVLYETEEQLLATDTDTQVDVYDTNATTAHVSIGPSGGNGPHDATFEHVSEDGQRALFSTAESLVGADSDSSIDLYEREDATTSRISVGSAGNGAHHVSFADASADARTAIFTTSEQLVTADTDSVIDVYAARAPAGYARPAGATPLRVSLVPAYQACSAPNRTHGPPLGFGSCAPPQQSSQELTVGAFDANGQPALSVGSLRLGTQVGNPSTPADEADVAVILNITDVREQSGLADYTGEIAAVLAARITDRQGGGATTEDFTFELVAQCGATGGSAGATCALNTSFDAIAPGAVVEGERTLWELEGIEVTDGGGDGVALTQPNGVFARQGVFVP
jgi:microcystin-dependent protein